MFASGLDSQEPDSEVLKLIKDLATIDEALTSTLHPRKCKVSCHYKSTLDSYHLGLIDTNPP